MTLKRLIITFSGLLLLGLLIQWWLLYFSGFNIARHIPYTPIDILGLLLIILLLVVLIIFIKKVVRQDDAPSMIKLTMAGTIVCFVAEFIFQLIKLFTQNDEALRDRIIDLGTGVIGITFFGAVFSFFIAYQIRTKRTGLLLIFIAAFLAFVVFLRTLLPPALD